MGTTAVGGDAKEKAPLKGAKEGLISKCWQAKNLWKHAACQREPPPRLWRVDA